MAPPKAGELAGWAEDQHAVVAGIEDIQVFLAIECGLLTPPFGLLLFTMKGVAPPGITMQQIYAASLPYIVFGVLVLTALFLFPPLATWLPGVLGN